jgi:hypothetical protein
MESVIQTARALIPVAITQLFSLYRSRAGGSIFDCHVWKSASTDNSPFRWRARNAIRTPLSGKCGVSQLGLPLSHMHQQDWQEEVEHYLPLRRIRLQADEQKLAALVALWVFQTPFPSCADNGGQVRLSRRPA